MERSPIREMDLDGRVKGADVIRRDRSQPLEIIVVDVDGQGAIGGEMLANGAQARG